MRGALLAVIAVALAACGGAGTVAPAVTSPGVAATGTPYVPPAPAATAQDSAGGYSDYYGYGTPAPKAAGPTGPLQLIGSAKLGKVLAASNGLTLYTNKNDTPKSSACNSACAQIWPPLLTTSGAPAAPSGLTGTLGTVTWSDGTVQVTYNGQPLYLYAGDSKPGDTNGEGIDGIWAAVKT